MKRLIKSLLSHTNYEIRRRQVPRDPFTEQQKLLPDAQVIFDIGAYTGTVSLRYAELFPKATVYSFEPLPESIEALKKSINGHGAIRPVQCAVSDQDGEAVFYSNREGYTNSLLPATGEATAHDPRIYENLAALNVPVTTIDSFCRAQSIARIDILKMDIQGAELRALQGAQEMLARTSLVYTEVEFARIYENQPLFCDVAGYLTARGFHLFALYDVYHDAAGRLIFGDALFVRN